MNPEFASVFTPLRGILQKHAAAFIVKESASGCYSLEAPAGPAAIKAWRGEVRKPVIPVAWVQIGKAYVSFHLMGVYGNRKLLDGMSDELKARMQGKTCFNFKAVDETLFQELDLLTGQSIAAFRKAGFISERGSR